MSEADFMGLANGARKMQQAVNELGAGPTREPTQAQIDAGAKALRQLAPAGAVDRIWGRLSAAEHERIHGVPPSDADSPDKGNGWAADPEDIARVVLNASADATPQ